MKGSEDYKERNMPSLTFSITVDASFPSPFQCQTNDYGQAVWPYKCGMKGSP